MSGITLLIIDENTGGVCATVTNCTIKPNVGELIYIERHYYKVTQVAIDYFQKTISAYITY